MLRIVIIGGTGHVGTYLVPRLVHSGYEVLSIRGVRASLIATTLRGSRWSM
jgi:nucleoside-diphosphate-sugar epimerase